MKRIFSLVLATLLLAPPLASAQSTKPLVILRFNQPRVEYEQPLYDAISRAVALKPDVTFDLVSYAPATGDMRTDAAWQTTASHNAQAVAATMQRLGVPLSRVRISGQQQPGIYFDEVHVFVR